LAGTLPSSDASDKMQVTITPRFGINGMADQGAFQVSSQFATGIGLSVAATDNLSLELGYTYAEYGINLASSNPLIQYIQAYSGGNNASMSMNQNIIDLNAKLYLMGPDSRIRPFVGLGAGYSFAYVNYNSQILNYINQMGYQNVLGNDYNLNSVLGDLSTGVDFKVGKSVSVGVMFKYYRVLSSTESNNIFNGNYMNSAFGVVQNADKQYVTDSLSGANFYSAMAGVSFSF
jgi:outer membrane protein W